MPGKSVKIPSREGGEFDCYLAMADGGGPAPGVVLASAVHGVDADIMAIADELAAGGFIAAAPDLFWRTIPGPLAHDDDRTKQRSQPRLDRIKEGEADMADSYRAIESALRSSVAEARRRQRLVRAAMVTAGALVLLAVLVMATLR